MLSRHDILSALALAKPALKEKYSVNTIALFGSFSRNDATSKSDIDLLVDFNGPIGIGFVRLAEELETLLQHRVDLVSLNGIKPKYLRVIKQELIYV